MRFCLIICIVAACNTGRVSFQPEEETKKIEDKNMGNENAVVKGQHSQIIDPVATDRPLDILLVIDSSRSMDEAHKSLATKLSPLLESVKKGDWRIVITTATFTDCLRAVIDKGDKDANGNDSTETMFVDAIKKLEYVRLLEEEKKLSHVEDTVRMATKALPTVDGSYNLPLRSLETQRVGGQDYDKRYTDPLFFTTRPTWCTGDVNHKNAGENSPRAHWLRDGSMLAILLITDEDAHSGDVNSDSSISGHQQFQPPEKTIGLKCGCQHDDPVRSCQCIDDLWKRISALRTPHVTAKIYGLLNDRRSKFYLNWRSEDGKSLFNKGDVWPVAGTDKFDGVLSKISASIAKQMDKTYFLDHFHDGKTSTVVFVYKDKREEQQPTTSYQIDGRTLKFNESPATEVDKIKVTFSFSHSQ